MPKLDKKENIRQLSRNTAYIKHLMRTGKEQLHKERFGDKYGKKLNKAWTEVVVVGKKNKPRSRNTMATNQKK